MSPIVSDTLQDRALARRRRGGTDAREESRQADPEHQSGSPRYGSRLQLTTCAVKLPEVPYAP